MKHQSHLGKEDTPTMYEVYQMPLESLEKLDFKSLQKLYQPSDPNHKLSREVINILETDKPLGSTRLKDAISYYEEMIVVFSRMGYLFHRAYCTDPKSNADAIQFFEACQLNLNRLQSVYNQLVYNRQIRVAYLALGLSIFFSVVSLLLTLFGDYLPMNSYVYVP